MDEIDAVTFLAAVAQGRVIEAPGTRIDGALIRRVCVNHAGEVDRRGIRLRGLTVAGELDLTAVEVPFALRFEGCSFEAAPIMHGARVKGPRLPRLPAAACAAGSPGPAACSTGSTTGPSATATAPVGCCGCSPPC